MSVGKQCVHDNGGVCIGCVCRMSDSRAISKCTDDVGMHTHVDVTRMLVCEECGCSQDCKCVHNHVS